MSILIKSATLPDFLDENDIYIEGNRIKVIGQSLDFKADTVISGHKKAVIPGFVNMHTHTPMTLFRGIGDDMPLKPWLEKIIWPIEAKMTDEDIYWGAKLACLEMIKSGTTTFFDMYYKVDAIAAAVEEMGLRAVLSDTCFDWFKPELTEACKRNITKRFEKLSPYPSSQERDDRLSTINHSGGLPPLSYGEKAGERGLIRIAIGPHAIYTVSGDLLQWIHAFATERDLLIHLHLAETEEEVRFCREQFGTTPVRYLLQLGILSPRLFIAHVLYVDEEEITLLAENGVKVVHNPASNMKLASGYRFLYNEMRAAGVQVGLGTDGCASSNSLDMIAAMRFASYLGKVSRMNPEVMPCKEMLEAATRTGAAMLGIDAGHITEGALADLCLVDLNLPAFTPNFNFVSNLVYAANGSCIDTVICDGKILMQDKKIPEEDEILERTNQAAHHLITKVNS